MTTEQKDTRNAYQYLVDSLALVQERGPSLSRAFNALAKTDNQIIENIEKEIRELKSLECNEENDELIALSNSLKGDVMARQATYMLISRFLDTNLLANTPSPYDEKDYLKFCDCCAEGEGE
jgi:seryl-tRNA synthetase